MAESYMHHVCTRQEARQIIDGRKQERFWVSNCGCREERGKCARSRHDVCLGLEPGQGSSNTGVRELTRAEVEEILRLAEEVHLVMRPFEDNAHTRIVGFCVCCDDCCGYFQHPEQELCGKGALIARTDPALCTDCGDCAEVCYFGARRLEGGRLAVDRERCYGCGLCLDVCPAACIEMVAR